MDPWVTGAEAIHGSPFCGSHILANRPPARAPVPVNFAVDVGPGIEFLRLLIHAGSMNSSGKNWKILLSLLPTGWQQAALEFGAVRRLRGFASPETLLRTLLLHVDLGYSLRETVVRARLADWADVSDVALLKRMRNSEQWLRSLCIALLRENEAFALAETVGAVRIVEGTN
jgi:hypothetical protein